MEPRSSDEREGRELRDEIVSAIADAFPARTSLTTGRLLTEAAHHDAGRAVGKALHTLPTNQRYRSVDDVVEHLEYVDTHGEAGRAR